MTSLNSTFIQITLWRMINVRVIIDRHHYPASTPQLFLGKPIIMQTLNQYSPELNDVRPVQPAVSILLPFEPQLRSKTEIQKELDRAVHKVSTQIELLFHNDQGEMVLQKLKKLIQQLNYNTFKKSIAICVSPAFEKIMYLSFPVEFRVHVDTDFHIRDIVHARKEDKSFLLVNLSRYATSIYLGNEHSFTRLNHNTRGQASLFPVPSFPHHKSFTVRNDLCEDLLVKFLRQTDQALQILLTSYPYPVFITGSPKIIGEFKKLTKHEKSIVNCIHGHFADSSLQTLKEIVQPALHEWQQIKLKELRQKIETAADNSHLAIGIRDVWKQAKAHNASLLVVEEDFSPAAILHPLKEGSYNYLLASNTVDDIIEKVLDFGGEVRIVDPGSLTGYNPIVLIERYCPLSQS